MKQATKIIETTTTVPDQYTFNSTSNQEVAFANTTTLLNYTVEMGTTSSPAHHEGNGVIGVVVAIVVVFIASVVVGLGLLYLRYVLKFIGRETFRKYFKCKHGVDKELDEVFCLNTGEGETDEIDKIGSDENDHNLQDVASHDERSPNRISGNSTSDSTSGTCASAQTTVLISPDVHDENGDDHSENEDDYVLMKRHRDNFTHENSPRFDSIEIDSVSFNDTQSNKSPTTSLTNYFISNLGCDGKGSEINPEQIELDTF